MSEMRELRFRKKPVVIEAFRLGEAWPDWWAEKHGRNEVTTHNEDGRWRGGPDYALIHTLEGVMRAERGDWIIRGVQGELYPCKPDIFAATYDKVIDPLPREEPMMPWLVTFIEKGKEYTWNIKAQSVTDARTHVEEALVERGCPGTVIRVEPDR